MTGCDHSVSTSKVDRTSQANRQVRSRRSAEGVGFEPTMKLTPHSGFQDRRHRPLGEPSADHLSARTRLQLVPWRS